MKLPTDVAPLSAKRRSPERRLTGEEKADLAIRLLREIAQYDPQIAERIRGIGLEPGAAEAQKRARDTKA